MSARSDDELALAYRQQVGREPARFPDDHPGRWQWEYRGRPEERESLLERLSEEDPVCVEQDALPGMAA